MNVARVSANGQITVPVEIRRALRLNTGDKVLFFKKDNGEIVVSNTSLVALHEMQSSTENNSISYSTISVDANQHRSDNSANPLVYALERFSKAMEGEWEKAGVHSEEDLIQMAAEARKEYMAIRRAKTGEA